MCGQTNGAGSMGFNDGRYEMYGYMLHVTGYEEFEMTSCRLTKILIIPVAMTLRWRSR
jgi:hypothetical protein